MASPPSTPPDPAPEAVAEGEGPRGPHLLTRERLLSGGVDEMVRAAMGAHLWSAEQRDASLQATLDAHPAPGEATWLFGYGSLIWNPTIHYEESRFARIEGWSRHFRLSTPIGRGTPEKPGLVLALDQGPGCEGVAFRLGEAALRQELDIIWRREMLTGAYIPRWLALHDGQGRRFGWGIAFTINHQGPHFADLTEAEVVHRLATAVGLLGSSADYLFQTRDGLRRLGIEDPLIDHLAQAVQAARATSSGGAA
jgi:cation transport protein ChaC